MPDPRTSPERLEPDGRALHEWTPDLVRAAWASAQAGNLRLAADLCDDLLADDTVGGTLDKRARGVVRLPLAFEPAKGAGRRAPIVRAAEADWYQANREDEHVHLISWALLLGVGLAELLWEERDGRVLPVLKTWHPRHLSYDARARAWSLQTSEGAVEVAPGDGKWLMLTPYGPRRPWARGRWRAVALWYLLKRYAMTDWARYGEKHGLGVFAGTLPESKAGDRAARKEFAQQLRDLGSNGAVAMPAGYDVKLLEATANTWQTFRAQVEAADAGIAVAVVGQNLTTRVAEGSRAAATVHETVQADLIAGDARALETTHREQQWRWWAEFNFGDAGLCPWPRYATAPRAQIDLSAYHLEYQLVTRDEARFALGLPPLEDGTGGEYPRPVAAQPAPPADAPPAPPAAANRRLASGAPASSAPGFVAGQLAADAVADAGARDTARLSRGDAARVLAAVLEAEDYDGLRAALLEVYAGLDPEAFAERVRQALVVAELTGQWAVLEDAR